MKALWSEHFPSGKKPEPAPAPALPPRQRFLICRLCNAAVCRLHTSATVENPGRQFYKCSSSDHNFFKWADEVKPDELIDVPNCGGCSAGVCRVRREKSGPNAGRILFMCRVKEGEGSCGYRVWQDELEMSVKERLDERVTSSQSTMTDCEDIGSTNMETRVTSIESAATNCDEIGHINTVVVEETRLGDDGVDYESPEVDTSKHLGCLGVTSGTMERHESLRRPPKRSRCGDLKAPGSSISASSLTLRLPRNSMSLEQCWIKAAIQQNLGTQLRGWWGRIAFHPMPCLMTHALKSFTFHVSSPFDSTILAKDKIPVHSTDSTILTTTLPGSKSYRNPLFNPAHNAELSCIKPFHVALDLPPSSEPFNETSNVMSKLISKAFSQAAKRLQNDLLTLLETMDVKDHEAMGRAAESTFAALDHLCFDDQDFKKRAEELILRARSLAEIEQCMPTNDSYQQLIDHCSSERMSLEKFNCFHAKAVDDVTNNKKRLKDLQEEVHSTVDWIFKIEAELSSFEVEMRTMVHRLDQISENKEVLEGQYLIMSNELEESQKFYERKQAERSAAKAAFDRAKASLRG